MSVNYHHDGDDKMKHYRVLYKEPGTGYWLTYCATDTEAEAWVVNVPQGEKRVVELVVLKPPKPIWEFDHRYTRIGGDGKVSHCIVVNGSGWGALQHYDDTITAASPMARAYYEDVTDA